MGFALVEKARERIGVWVLKNKLYCFGQLNFFSKYFN